MILEPRDRRSRYKFVLCYVLSIFFWHHNPLVGLGLLLIHEDLVFFRDHIQRHTTVGRSPLDE